MEITLELLRSLIGKPVPAPKCPKCGKKMEFWYQEGLFKCTYHNFYEEGLVMNLSDALLLSLTEEKE